jgi:hypothetical protein
LFNRIKLMLPVQSPFVKIFLFPSDANHLHIPRHPGPHKGAFRDRHERRVRDAMDASGAADESAILRTEKSCGPDASMVGVKLAMMLRIAPATVTNKPDHRGEREGNR